MILLRKFMRAPKKAKTGVRSDLLNYLQSSKNILITTHIQPDGDAIGSILAMGSWAAKNLPYAKATLMIKGQSAMVWDWWEGVEHITWVEEIAEHVEHFDTVIFLDSHSLSSFSERNEEFKEKLSNVKTGCIDHHPGNFEFAYGLVIKDETAISVCQVIAKELFLDDELDFKSAKDLTLGILYDAGYLKFVSHKNVQVLPILERLIRVGKLPQLDTLDMGADMFSVAEFGIFKKLVWNTTLVKLENVPNLAYTFLEEQDVVGVDPFMLKRARTFYSTKYILRKIADYPWGFIVTAKDDYFSISFRALPGGLDLTKLTERYFNGSGHKLSAGGAYYPTNEEAGITAREVCEKIVQKLSQLTIDID